MSDMLVIIPCGKKRMYKKSGKGLLARDAYTGNIFKWGVRYADACNADWVIFSPDSGYILPYTIIEEDPDNEKQKAPFSLYELQDQVRMLAKTNWTISHGFGLME
jgi:hypothetical protein